MIQSQVYAKNRQSPSNEADWIAAYKKRVLVSDRDDNYDIAAVITNDGIYGHAMMHYSYNRAKDGNYHPCYNFVSDDELRFYL